MRRPFASLRLRLARQDRRAPRAISGHSPHAEGVLLASASQEAVVAGARQEHERVDARKLRLRFVNISIYFA